MNFMQTESPDVLIVGAGACGSLVAKELAECGFSVVVISEAFVHRMNYGAKTGRVTGVDYLDAQRKEKFLSRFGRNTVAGSPPDSLRTHQVQQRTADREREQIIDDVEHDKP